MAAFQQPYYDSDIRYNFITTDQLVSRNVGVRRQTDILTKLLNLIRLLKCSQHNVAKRNSLQ